MITNIFEEENNKKYINGEIIDAIDILKNEIWSDTIINFYALRKANEEINKKISPKGMQKILNKILEKRFIEHKWQGFNGIFIKNKTWIRFTFRHQMSIGTDIMDALKAYRNNGMSNIMIFTVNRSTLDLISPKDSGSMVYYEKIINEYN